MTAVPLSVSMAGPLVRSHGQGPSDALTHKLAALRRTLSDQLAKEASTGMAYTNEEHHRPKAAVVAKDNEEDEDEVGMPKARRGHTPTRASLDCVVQAGRAAWERIQAETDPPPVMQAQAKARASVMGAGKLTERTATSPGSPSSPKSPAPGSPTMRSENVRARVSNWAAEGTSSRLLKVLAQAEEGKIRGKIKDNIAHRRKQELLKHHRICEKLAARTLKKLQKIKHEEDHVSPSDAPRVHSDGGEEGELNPDEMELLIQQIQDEIEDEQVQRQEELEDRKTWRESAQSDLDSMKEKVEHLMIQVEKMSACRCRPWCSESMMNS